MPIELGSHSDRLAAVGSLQTVKGRKERGRFCFEGATLLEEAHSSGLTIEELYVTRAAYDGNELVRRLDADGTPTYVVGERSAAKISDLESPTGIVSIALMRSAPIGDLFGGDGLLLILADLNDPGNAGTLLRSADAFGCRGVVFGRAGVDPYHPKVVRGAMGATFRLRLAVGEPAEVAAAAQAGGFEIVGLTRDGEPLEGARWAARCAVVVGHERRGLGPWERICAASLSIAMAGPAESLNAAVAGSIALYEASRKP